MAFSHCFNSYEPCQPVHPFQPRAALCGLKAAAIALVVIHKSHTDPSRLVRLVNQIVGLTQFAPIT